MSPGTEAGGEQGPRSAVDIAAPLPFPIGLRLEDRVPAT